MDIIDDKSKVYENLSLVYDPHYAGALDAIAIIKKFIVDRGLILYGGTSNDYAVRLHGSAIYPDEMLAIPDLDFYSPNSVQDAYDLADILYRAGYLEARAINALYVITMRVDIVDNHFLADISYVPPEIFEKLPYIMYEGMKVIDPVYQKIDFHSCLAFPFDNPPREVIFEKWRKYIQRYNLIHSFYPTPDHHDVIELKKVTVPYPKGLPAADFIAYAVIYDSLVMLSGKKKLPDEIIKASVEFIDNNVTTGAIQNQVAFVYNDLAAAGELSGLTDIKSFATYINILPKYISGKCGNVTVKIYSTENRLVSTHDVTINGATITIVSIQYLLMQFLVLAHISEGKIKSTYYAYYESLLLIIRTAEKLFADIPESATKKKLMLSSPFFPTVNVFGDANESAAHKISLGRIDRDLGKQVEVIPTPRGYHPSRGKPSQPFDYSSSVYFIKDGRQLN